MARDSTQLTGYAKQRQQVLLQQSVVDNSGPLCAALVSQIAAGSPP